MSRDGVSLESVIDGLQAEGLLAEDEAARAAALVHGLHEIQPWYVRAMVGIGAWLASLLLIGFVAGFGLATGASALVGAALVAGAVAVRRQPVIGGNDFVVQSALAVSLAGQALFTWGVADVSTGDDVELLCLTVMAVSTVLFFVYPDRIHRVLMVVFACGAAVILIYALELNALVPLLGPLLAGVLVLLDRARPAIHGSGRGWLVQPLETGLLLSAFGCLLLSTVYLLPELDVDFAFYPRPWISTLLLGAVFLYVGHRVRPALLPDAATAPPVVTAGLMLAMIAAAWQAPGILLALTVTMLGTARGHTTFALAGVAFLAVFTIAYFYGIEVSMLTKSITLVATGAAVLTMRWLLLRLLGDQT